MKILSASIRLNYEGALRAADPVDITVHLPEGALTVQGWVAEIRYEPDPRIGGMPAPDLVHTVDVTFHRELT